MHMHEGQGVPGEGLRYKFVCNRPFIWRGRPFLAHWVYKNSTQHPVQALSELDFDQRRVRTLSVPAKDTPLLAQDMHESVEIQPRLHFSFLYPMQHVSRLPVPHASCTALWQVLHST